MAILSKIFSEFLLKILFMGIQHSTKVWCTAVIFSWFFRPMVRSFSWMEFYRLVNSLHPEKNGYIEIRFCSSISSLRSSLYYHSVILFVQGRHLKEFWEPPGDSGTLKNTLMRETVSWVVMDDSLFFYIPLFDTWHMVLLSLSSFNQQEDSIYNNLKDKKSVNFNFPCRVK